jgi:hypothetical protein
VITSGRWNVCFTDNSGPTWSRLSNLTTRSFAVSALGSFDFPVLGGGLNGSMQHHLRLTKRGGVMGRPGPAGLSSAKRADMWRRLRHNRDTKAVLAMLRNGLLL